MMKHVLLLLCLWVGVVVLWAGWSTCADDTDTDTGSAETEAPKPITDEQYQQRVAHLRKQLGDGYTVVLSKPFVVVGDEPAAVVQRRAQRTVGWAVKRLKEAYFTKDPDRIITVWLFKDKASYESHCEKLFNIEPTTPFGFYSPGNDALVMNIATGGGTLVHEIVHPLVEANFPECPAWFNEGLGSLYEQSGERNKRIVGFTNWRLPGLQKAIRAKKLPTFKSLCSTTTHEFYRQDPGTNYGQARYLCYYLQEKGLLRRYYRAFHKNHEDDPTGYDTLVTVLGERDMAAFQKRWEAWVLKLEFK